VSTPDAAGTAQRKRLQPRDRAHDDAGHTRERGGIRDNVGAVVDVGDATRRARNADGGSGRRRRFGDNDVRAGAGEQPGDKRDIERHIGDVSAYRSRAVAQDGGAAHLDEAGALLFPDSSQKASEFYGSHITDDGLGIPNQRIHNTDISNVRRS